MLVEQMNDRRLPVPALELDQVMPLERSKGVGDAPSTTVGRIWQIKKLGPRAGRNIGGEWGCGAPPHNCQEQLDCHGSTPATGGHQLR
ncbi:hypothetical protein ACFQ9D_16450 [Arthrobacter koreensis]|uniref:hypothetical protein n=1 Tax=Arthrobacter koreensis TaxID=199136 RepID=UPI0036713064